MMLAEKTFRWGFRAHDSVVQWLASTRDVRLRYGPDEGDSLSVKRLKWVRVVDQIGRQEFETVHVIGGCVVMLTASIEHDTPEIVWTAYPVYGDIRNPRPTHRRNAWLALETGDYVCPLDLVVSEGDSVLAGQGSGVRSFRLITTLNRTTDASPRLPRTPSDYAWPDMTQTGGEWLYMGIDFPEFTLWEARAHFYPYGNYPGTFVNPNVGMMVGEDMHPNSVLHGGTHFHKDAQGSHIQYTHPSTPWRDRAGKTLDGQRWVSPDDQHLCYVALCQAYMQHPLDAGLRYLVIAAAHRVTMQIPGRDKGTSHDNAGTSRARGRILHSLVWLWRALGRMQETQYSRLQVDPLRARVGTRAIERFQIQVDQWLDDLQRNREPWPFFETGGYSIAEAGIWYWGLDSMADVLSQHGVNPPAELPHMMQRISEFVFTGFRKSGDRWVIPYEWFPWDESKNRHGDGGVHFAWLAAINHQPKDQIEADKLASIYALRHSIDARFRGERKTGVHSAR